MKAGNLVKRFNGSRIGIITQISSRPVACEVLWSDGHTEVVGVFSLQVLN